MWPKTFVSDEPRTTITEIATRSDDAGKPRCRTITQSACVRGTYNRTAPSITRHKPRHCWIVYGSREFFLAEGENLIGRSDSVTVRLESPNVSRRHARIVISSSDAVLEDLGSKNGTYLRGEKLTTRESLRHGDEISVGPFRLAFRISQRSDPTKTNT